MDHILRIPATHGLATLLLRVALGAMWLTHAIVLKVMTFGIDGLAQWLGSQGYPPLLAWPLVLAEAIGGTLILLGVHGRWISLALQPILIGALVVHAGNGWVFTAANGGWEYPAFLMVASIVHALLGDGPHAVVPERR
jgi:putative oxidoreductase